MKLNFSDYISFSALIVSLATFFYNLYSSKSHLEIKDKKYTMFSELDDADKYNFEIECSIENHSKYPIKITKIKFNNNYCFKHQISLKGVGFIKFNQPIQVDFKTFELPIHLDPFQSCNGSILIESESPIKLKFINLLKVYTTRGVHYFLIFNPQSKTV